MIDVIFDGGKYVVASKIYAYDYGQKLRVWGLQLPAVVEAHFSRCGSDGAVLSMGTCEGDMTVIPVPDSMLSGPGSFGCAIFIREDGEGESAYMMRLEVLKRPALPTAVTEPTEQEISYFEAVLDEIRDMLGQASGSNQNSTDGITIDAIPTEDSTNPVASGGVFDAINAIETVGENCKGKTFTYDDNDVTASVGAERFNSYSGNQANKAIGGFSHAEGLDTTASGHYSHAEGHCTIASGANSHAEGYQSVASGQSSHAEGDHATASGNYSHAEGDHATACGDRSHAEGSYTIAKSSHSHVQGKYNIEDSQNKYADIIGNGTGNSARSNAQATSWTGVLWTALDVRCGGDDMDDVSAISLADLAQRIAALEQAVGI